MNNILDVICYPLGKFLYFIYNTIAFHNYGFALIIFTVLIKLVLMPLTVKQYRSSAKMQELQPIIQEVQKRYKNDREKLNQEMMKVYQEHNYNPAGGCLPMLVQMPILISLYWVIAQPMKFLLGKNLDTITKLVDIATKSVGAKGLSYLKELGALNYFNEHKEALSQTAGLLNSNELINFNFLGLHLGKIASYNTADLFGPQAYIYLPLLLLPILAVITTFISTKLSMPKPQKDGAGQNAMASSMTNSMLYIGPVMTLIFSFQLPAGLVLYWSAGYVFTIFQQLYINKHVIKKNVSTVEVKAIPDKTGADNQNKQAGNKQAGNKKKGAARKK